MGTSKSSNSSKGDARRALINDLQDVARKNHKVIVTRNFYRGSGKYPESAWQAHFAKFSDFMTAAGIRVTAKAEQTTPSTPTETNEVVGNTWTVTLPKTRISTLEELLAFCKVDTSVWQVERWVCNKYEMGAKDETGKLQVE